MKLLLVTLTTLALSTSFADIYKIDTAASNVEWKAGKKIGSFHNGKIQIKSGEFVTDKKGAIKSADVIVDMKTISNTDLKDSQEYQKKLIGHLSSDDFFKVEKFPESVFKLTTITPKAGSKDQYTVKGDLTLIGVTKTVEFPATISSDKKALNGTATMTIERLNWGLQYGSGSVFKTLTADKIINDTFDLTINFVAKK
jgi:polyisoprenoid-binding protein YceI